MDHDRSDNIHSVAKCKGETMKHCTRDANVLEEDGIQQRASSEKAGHAPEDTRPKRGNWKLVFTVEICTFISLSFSEPPSFDRPSRPPD